MSVKRTIALTILFAVFGLLLSLTGCTEEKEVWLDLYIYNDDDNYSIDIKVFHVFDIINDLNETYENIKPGEHIRFETGIVGTIGGFLDTTGESEARFEIKYSDTSGNQSSKIYYYHEPYSNGHQPRKEMSGEQMFSFKNGKITKKEKQKL